VDERLTFALYASRKVGNCKTERKLIRDLTSKQADERTRELVNDGYQIIVCVPAAGPLRWADVKASRAAGKLIRDRARTGTGLPHNALTLNARRNLPTGI
jgi:hypothetical protein